MMTESEIAAVVRDVVHEELQATLWGRRMIEAAVRPAREAGAAALGDRVPTEAANAARHEVTRHLAHLAGRLGEPLDAEE